MLRPWRKKLLQNEVRNSLCGRDERRKIPTLIPYKTASVSNPKSEITKKEITCAKKSTREEIEVTKRKCTRELCEKMYGFFKNYTGDGAPSFSKFARETGLTLERLESFKENGEFNRIYRECKEIRRDIIIDKALTKRADASFAKFLLSEEGGGDGEDRIDLTITVIE